MKITTIKEKKIWDSDNWPLNTGWPLDIVLLNISLTVAAFHDILKKRLTLHSDISSYCLFLSHSIACDANIFSCIIPVTTRDNQLFGVWKLNPRFFPSYLRFRKTRGITAQKQRSWSINCYILWHFCELDRNWKRGEEQKSFHTITIIVWFGSKSSTSYTIEMRL